jgi:hypothetical protein
MAGKYDEKEAAKDTSSSNKEVAGAWHDARDDSGAREDADAAHFERAPTDEPQSTDSGVSLYPEHKK